MLYDPLLVLRSLLWTTLANGGRYECTRIEMKWWTWLWITTMQTQKQFPDQSLSLCCRSTDGSIDLDSSRKTPPATKRDGVRCVRSNPAKVASVASPVTDNKEKTTIHIYHTLQLVCTYGSLDEFMSFVTKAPPPSSNPERIYMALEPQYIWHPIDPFGLCHERNSHSVCPFATNKL